MSEPAKAGLNFISGLTIVKVLSNEGTFSTVYEGYHPIHKQVAVKAAKLLPGENQNQFDVRQSKLLGEGLKLKEAEHRNVVRVLDVLQATSGEVVMVTEFCSGGSAKTLATGDPLCLPVARKIFVETAMGLQALHSINMIHRDIKPANILIGDKGVARIADFGFVTDPLMNGVGLPNTYGAHKAPECLGPGAIGTFRSDIWAFGLTAYRLLHSELDWKALGHIPTLVEAGQLTQRLTWLPHIPKEWRDFIKRCLNKTPANRFATFSDVVSALERLPIEPDWVCQSSLTSVKWTRDHGKRVHEVIWDRSNADFQKWSATNRPKDGNGQQRTIKKSNGLVIRKEAEAGLEQFFESLRR